CQGKKVPSFRSGLRSYPNVLTSILRGASIAGQMDRTAKEFHTIHDMGYRSEKLWPFRLDQRWSNSSPSFMPAF
ncbi:MAG: hypothetical protein ACXVK3_16130, partial [Candidatus Angelobacter sp.]